MTDRTQQALSLLRLTPFDCSSESGRARERHRRALLTSLTAVAAKAISVLSLLLTVPLTLGYLGPERYGMWMTIGSLVAMMSFADLGMGNGLLNAIAEAHGREDRQAMRSHIASAYLILGLVALLIVAGFALLYGVVDWPAVFNVTSAAARSECGPALAVFVACFAFNIPLTIVQRVQIGLQQGFTANLWQGVGGLLGLLGIVLAVQSRAPLPWLVAGAVGLPMLAALANTLHFFLFARRDLAPAIAEACMASFRRLAGTGLLFFGTQIAIAIAYLSDNLVLTHILGPEAVTQYSVPERMFSLIATVVAMALTPLWPAYGEAAARGDHVWVKRTLIRSLKLAGGTAAVLSLLLVIAGPTLIGLWVGHVVTVPLSLIAALGVWKVAEAIGNALAMYLNGVGMIRIQAILGVTMALSAISLKVALVPLVGVAGVTIATVLAYGLMVLLPLAWFVPRSLTSRSQ